MKGCICRYTLSYQRGRIQLLELSHLSIVSSSVSSGHQSLHRVPVPDFGLSRRDNVHSQQPQHRHHTQVVLRALPGLGLHENRPQQDRERHGDIRPRHVRQIYL